MNWYYVVCIRTFGGIGFPTIALSPEGTAEEGWLRDQQAVLVRVCWMLDREYHVRTFKDRPSGTLLAPKPEEGPVG